MISSGGGNVCAQTGPHIAFTIDFQGSISWDSSLLSSIGRPPAHCKGRTHTQPRTPQIALLHQTTAQPQLWLRPIKPDHRVGTDIDILIAGGTRSGNRSSRVRDLEGELVFGHSSEALSCVVPPGRWPRLSGPSTRPDEGEGSQPSAAPRLGAKSLGPRAQRAALGRQQCVLRARARSRLSRARVQRVRARRSAQHRRRRRRRRRSARIIRGA